MMIFKHLARLALFAVSASTFAAQAVVVTDMNGEHKWSQPAKRVVVLNWSAAEAMYVLGVKPVGVADPEGYNTWVKEPEAPEDITSVGMRGEPNMELIHQLKPDAILSGSGQPAAYDSLSQIAPVLSFDTFRDDHDNGQAVDDAFLKMAKVVGKEAQAKQYLAERTQKIAQWREALNKHFNHNIPKVTMVHFVDLSHASVSGNNSTVEYALSQLGIEPALQTNKSAWGQTNLPLQSLASIKDGVVIYVRPFAQEKRLFSSALWQHLPFVRQGNFLTVEPCWVYGSAASIEHIAQVATQALLTLPAR